MTSWLKNDNLNIEIGCSSENEKAVKIFLSPYDIPDAVRAYSEGRNLIIEFRYIHIKESMETHKEDEFIEFEVGVRTKRIYKIRVSPSSAKEERINITAELDELDSAIDHFITEQEKISKRLYMYEAPKRILHDYGEKLDSLLAARAITNPG